MVYYSKALAVWIALLSGPAAYAGVIAFSGLITQSTQDGTGPAVNNSALNGIADGDPYTVELTFPGQISVPGAWSPLLGAVVVFSDSSNSEAAFSSASVTVSADSNPTLYDVNVFACLSTGSGCYVGNSLSANFS